jgi:hypothetical protein
VCRCCTGRPCSAGDNTGVVWAVRDLNPESPAKSIVQWYLASHGDRLSVETAPKGRELASATNKVLCFAVGTMVVINECSHLGELFAQLCVLAA